MVREHHKEPAVGAIPWAKPVDDPWLGARKIVRVRPHVWRWLSEHVGDADVLEIGPGTRPTVPPASSHFVDRSPHALGLLAARGGTVSVAQDRLPYPDSTFRAVAAFEVLEHIESDDRLLGEIVRVLRPGGRLVLSVPIRASMWSPLDDVCGHVRRYEPEDLFDRLSGTGVEVGGYAWHPASRPRIYRMRARILLRQRRLLNTIGQSVAFPALSAYQRRFERMTWTSPEVPVPAAAEHLMLWAQVPEVDADSALRTSSNDATATST